jgi:hypothetical protein
MPIAHTSRHSVAKQVWDELREDDLSVILDLEQHARSLTFPQGYGPLGRGHFAGNYGVLIAAAVLYRIVHKAEQNRFQVVWVHPNGNCWERLRNRPSKATLILTLSLAAEVKEKPAQVGDKRVARVASHFFDDFLRPRDVERDGKELVFLLLQIVSRRMTLAGHLREFVDSLNDPPA